MPDKTGRLNTQEKRFVERYVATGDATYSAEKAGYRSPQPRGSQNLAKPAIAAEIRSQQLARLNNALLPLALDNIENILRSDKASERGKLTAAKIVIDRTAGAPDGTASKELHEMSAEELQAAIDRLRREASDRSKPVKVIEHEHEPESSIFE